MKPYLVQFGLPNHRYSICVPALGVTHAIIVAINRLVSLGECQQCLKHLAYNRDKSIAAVVTLQLDTR